MTVKATPQTPMTIEAMAKCTAHLLDKERAAILEIVDKRLANTVPKDHSSIPKMALALLQSAYDDVLHHGERLVHRRSTLIESRGGQVPGYVKALDR